MRHIKSKQNTGDVIESTLLQIDKLRKVNSKMKNNKNVVVGEVEVAGQILQLETGVVGEKHPYAHQALPMVAGHDLGDPQLPHGSKPSADASTCSKK